MYRHEQRPGALVCRRGVTSACSVQPPSLCFGRLPLNSIRWLAEGASRRDDRSLLAACLPGGKGIFWGGVERDGLDAGFGSHSHLSRPDSADSHFRGGADWSLALPSDRSSTEASEAAGSIAPFTASGRGKCYGAPRARRASASRPGGGNSQGRGRTGLSMNESPANPRVRRTSARSFAAALAAEVHSFAALM
jgi:hypothetical protein